MCFVHPWPVFFYIYFNFVYFLYLGHNWGSEHDPTSGTCAPGSVLDNGKYLMFHYAVSGEDGNNNVNINTLILYIWCIKT